MTRRPHPLERLVAPLLVLEAQTWVECTTTCAVHWQVTLSNEHGQTHRQQGIRERVPSHNTDWFDFWKGVAITLSQGRSNLIAAPIVANISRPTILRTIVYANIGKNWWKDDLRGVLEYQKATPEFIELILSVDVGVFAEVQRLCNLRLYANPD